MIENDPQSHLGWMMARVAETEKMLNLKHAEWVELSSEVDQLRADFIAMQAAIEAFRRMMGLPATAAAMQEGQSAPTASALPPFRDLSMADAAEIILRQQGGQPMKVAEILREMLAGGKEVVYLELQMYVGAKNPADTIELTGHPNIRLTIPGGTHGDVATASVVVNTIPAILDAPAGLRTSRDLPLGFFAPGAKP